MPKISIIVPVYNAEKYLRRCIDSILAQTFTDFELLLVDDGSKDSSPTICDEYAKKDTRVRVFHKENGGVSSARNVGLDNARGEWVCFVDADDLIETNYLVSLLDVALLTGADSSMGGFRYIDTEQKIEIIPKYEGKESIEDNIREFYACVAPDWQRYLWNRLLRVNVIKEHHLRFREDIFYKEDGLFVIEFLCASNGIVGCTKEVVYNYRQNQDGTMGSIQNNFNVRLLTDIDAHLLINKTLSTHQFPDYIRELAIKHAIGAYHWVKSKMNDSNVPRSHYIYIEKRMFQLLGLKRYVLWNTNKIANAIRRHL